MRSSLICDPPSIDTTRPISSLTPRLVRQEAEDELKVTRNTLDAQKYKDVVKRAIKNAMVREYVSTNARTNALTCQHPGQNPEANARRGKKAGKNGPVPKAGESTRRSSLSKFAKSKVCAARFRHASS